MKTIELYQDPKTGIYESILDMAKRNGIKIVYARDRYMEEIYLVGIINALEVPPMPSLNFLNYQDEGYKRDYTTKPNYKQPEKARQMSRQTRHTVWGRQK